MSCLAYLHKFFPIYMLLCIISQSSFSDTSILSSLSPGPMEQEIDQLIFNMGSLGTNFPPNGRGLSRCYSGKSRSFACIIADVHSVEDLKKPKKPDAKAKKKYSERTELLNPPPPYPCRRAPSCAQLSVPYVNV